ncbi:MAG: hypothetical protein Q8L47_00285 [bacterium]|nr:hypothetical protein [bacterium]
MKINTTALIRSTIFAIWYVVIVAIGSEFYKPLKDFFVKVGGHHWTGKSIMTILLTAVLYLILSRMKESENPEKGIYAIIINAIIGGFAIFGYFLWHYLSA